LATGVLPILVGRATKALSFIPDTPKEYVADFILGITTDTQDIQGKILSRDDRDLKIKALDVEEKLNDFLGDTLQIPPMYSAIKQKGKKLYELARKGIEVEREARRINIDKIKLIEFSEVDKKGTIFVSCSKGTYIRTICHDLGQKLGCGATLTELSRIKSCGFSIQDSVTLETIENNPRILSNVILPIDSLFSKYPKIHVSDSQAKSLLNGRGIDFTCKTDYDVLCVYKDEKFIGIAKVIKELQKIKMKLQSC
jgi:tRNA pseudouridine55 synthase